MPHPFELRFTLKQHTPLIHFQHDQPGATLRASEVKPKLDRFLIEKFKKEGTDYQTWLIPNKEALDYKMRIVAKGEPKKLAIDYDVTKDGKFSPKFPCVFGNVESEDEKKTMVLFEAVSLTFFSCHHKLREAISSNIESFFLLTNFGYRQSKGFGSFTVEGTDHLSDNHLFALRFMLPVASSGFDDGFKKIFNQIDVFYKSLRSGINRIGSGGVSKFYIKPAIFYYSMNVLGEQWDKKSIKSHFLPRDLRRQIEDHKDKDHDVDVLAYQTDLRGRNHLLIKDVFGLSSEEQWQSYRGSVTKKNSTIDRMQSPLMFKPIKVNDNKYFVGVLANDVPGDFLGKRFEIEFSGQGGLHLTTPELFSWNDFFRYLKNECPSIQERANSAERLESQSEYQILNHIYNQL